MCLQEAVSAHSSAYQSSGQRAVVRDGMTSKIPSKSGATATWTDRHRVCTVKERGVPRSSEGWVLQHGEVPLAPGSRFPHLWSQSLLRLYTVALLFPFAHLQFSSDLCAVSGGFALRMFQVSPMSSTTIS